MATKYEVADRAVQAHDHYAACNVGRPYDAARIEQLTVSAFEACRAAARDRSVNQATRNYYAKLRDLFQCWVEA